MQIVGGRTFEGERACLSYSRYCEEVSMAETEGIRYDEGTMVS